MPVGFVSPPRRSLSPATQPEASPPTLMMLSGGMGGGHTSPATAIVGSVETQGEVAARYEQVAVTPFRRDRLDDLRYRLSNHTAISDRVVEPYRRRHKQKATYLDVARRIEAVDPDLLAVNHRILAQAADYALPPDTPMVVITADHGPIHVGWYTKRLRDPNSPDILVVPNAAAFVHAVDHGVPQAKIRILGAAVRASFEAVADTPKAELREKLGIPRDKRVLVMSGGSGHWGGYLCELLAEVANAFPELHIVAIAGASGELKSKLESLDLGIDVLGYCDETRMAELTRAADVAGIKAGGATIGECYATGTIPLVYQKLSGVESGNLEHMAREGTGIIALTIGSFIEQLRQLDPAGSRAEAILANQKRFITVGAAARMARLASEMTKLSHDRRAPGDGIGG